MDYEGDLDEQDSACGWGISTYTTKQETVTYVGTFFDDKAEGAGVLTDKWGNKFDGEQRAGRLHGDVNFYNKK